MSAGSAELRQLFHTLNNQLGIILSHAELIEAKAQDERQKARASQVVIATVEALTTARQIRQAVEGAPSISSRRVDVLSHPALRQALDETAPSSGLHSPARHFCISSIPSLCFAEVYTARPAKSRAGARSTKSGTHVALLTGTR